MTVRDKRRYEMLIRVRNFGAAHGQLFPATSTVHAAFAIIAAEVEQLEALDVAERLASHSARAPRKRAARRSLHDILMRGKRVARVLARTIPELADDVNLPQALDDPLLLTMARQFSAAASAHAEQFAANGIQVSDIEQRIDAFEKALEARGLRHEEHVQSRALLDKSLARALEALEMLDVAVPNHLAGDAAMLAVWTRERLVSRPKRRTSSDAPPSPDPAPAPDTGEVTTVVPLRNAA